MNAVIKRSGGPNAITEKTIGGTMRSLGDGINAVATQMQANNKEEFTEAAKQRFYAMFNHQLLQPTKAAGHLKLTSTKSVTIAAGSAIKNTSGAEVATVAKEAVFTGTETKLVEVIANQAGSSINYAAGTLELVKPPEGISGNNPAAVTGGRDLETELERSIRFKSYLEKYSKGTEASIVRTAEEISIKNDKGEVIEAVTSAIMVYPWKVGAGPRGINELYIKSSLPTPSTAPNLTPPVIQDGSEIGGLIGKVKQEIDGYTLSDAYGNKTFKDGVTAGGIETVVKAAVPNIVSFKFAIKPKEGKSFADVEPKAEAAIRDYVNSLKNGSRLTATDWQSQITKVSDVDYMDESTAEHRVGIKPPETISLQAEYKYWFIEADGITITEITT